MISFASVDRVEDLWVICEVEEIPEEQSRTQNPKDVPTFMTEIPSYMFESNVEEGKIYIVEHDSENVSTVYCKDEHEYERRRDIIKELLKKIKG